MVVCGQEVRRAASPEGGLLYGIVFLSVPKVILPEVGVPSSAISMWAVAIISDIIFSITDIEA